jgi:hypothetical protein
MASDPAAATATLRQALDCGAPPALPMETPG